VTPAVLANLAPQVSGTPRPLAKVGIGVAVKRGAPLPEIGSVEAFKRALLAARAIAGVDPAAGGTSGVYLWNWFEKEGIAATLRPKAVLVPGGLSAEKLVSGEAEIAVQQMSELLAVPGAQVVGPVPAELQTFTVYAGVASVAAREPAAAAALLDFLAGPAAREVLAARGMEAP
jgi:molybdate transport system substrate-binding protein